MMINKYKADLYIFWPPDYKCTCFNKAVLKSVWVSYNESNTYSGLSYTAPLNLVSCHPLRLQEVGPVQLYGGFRDSSDLDRNHVLILPHHVLTRQEAGGVRGGADQKVVGEGGVTVERVVTQGHQLNFVVPVEEYLLLM